MADEPMTPAERVAEASAFAGSREERHHIMGQALTHMVQEGKTQVPEVPAPLVCKPKTIESWRVFKIMSEFVEGFEIIRKYGTAASFFGTARASFDSKLYEDATELASKLSKRGFAIITGGSAGVMEAANKGAYEAGGASVGLNIRLQDNQPMNKYLTEQMMFDHFFVRKVMLAYASEVYIFFPGGYGTLDEFTELITLIQTKNIQPIPIVLYGKEYWTPITEHFRAELFEKYHAIDESDLDLYRIVDTVDEAFDYIIKNVKC